MTTKDQPNQEQEAKAPTPEEQTDGFEVFTSDMPVQPDEGDTADDNDAKDTGEGSGKDDHDDGHQPEPEPTTKADRKKNRLQKRMDRLTARAREAERRAEEAERRLQEARGGKQDKADKGGEDAGKKPAAKVPQAEDFESYDDYLDALAEFHDAGGEGGEPEHKEEPEPTKDKPKQAKRKNESDGNADDDRVFHDALKDLMDAFEDAGDEYKDFDKVVKQPDLKITREMVIAMNDPEIADPAAIAYYLGTHKDEAERIAKAPPARQAIEIAKLEGKLSVSAPPVTKKTTKAPDPIKPVRGGRGSTRDVKDMSFAEYEATMNAREREKSFW